MYGISNLSDKQGVTLIPAYLHTHLNVESNSFMEESGPVWHFLPYIAHAVFVCILTYQSIPALLHLESSITSRSLKGECFNHPWQFQVNCIFPLTISLNRSNFISVRICHRSVQAYDSYCAYWMGLPWLLTILNMLGDCSLLVSHGKSSYQMCC